MFFQRTLINLGKISRAMKHLSERTLKNFLEWYKKLTGKKIHIWEIKKVSKKFDK